MELAIHAREQAAACLHCGNPADASVGAFCCIGCRIVHGLLSAEHLDRFYELRGALGVPVVETRSDRRDLKWLDAIEDERRAGAETARVVLDVQGLRCSACVWLVETVFRRREGATAITVNPALGRAQLIVRRTFDLPAFVRDIERFGYLFGPPLKRAEARSSGLAVRMGVCIALAMNAMIFAIALYAGLREGPTYVLFQRVNLALSCVCVAVGGTVFFRSAWEGLRRRVLHLDLPIALGIALAFGGSLWSYAAHRDRGVFIDTLDVFIALMLVGRYLQERVLEKNRLSLLASDGVEGLLARRVRDGRLETVRCTELRRGDSVIVAPGDVVPLDAALGGRDAVGFSLDWINGESREHSYAAGAMVPAGAFLAGTHAATLIAKTDFEASPLIDLLRTPQTRDADGAMSAPWWRAVTKWYVAGVLLAAAMGFLGWVVFARDLGRAVEVATAVLIVTCPCAFGIATPIAYDLVQAGLRRAGLFVRSAGFLDRAACVRTVVFDKTGTLTSGALRVARPISIDALDAHQRAVLFAMACASSHPKSIAVQRALNERDQRLVALDGVREIAGRGLSVSLDGDEYRFGLPSWVAPEASLVGDVAFGVNGRMLADITTEESLRPDARAEVAELRQAGFDVWLLSGDESARVTQAARVAGIREDHAIAAASPEAKAKWVAANDAHDLLMIGDGINDSLVVAQAFCSGTPAIDRPFMAARSDFYFVTPGLGPVRLALRAAAKLADVRRRNLVLAVAYNVIAVSLAYAGVMSPLLCAVLMPASSLTTILATTWSLNARSPLWRP